MVRSESRPELRKTDDYAGMARLAKSSGLDIDSVEDVIVAHGYYIGDRLVGCAALKSRDGTYLLEYLAVDEEFRGRGLGRSIVQEIESEARKRGVEQLWVLARQPGFFEKLGYSKTAPPEGGYPSTEGCTGCRQYRKSCYPAVLTKNL